MRKIIALSILFLNLASLSFADVPISLELLEVKKIWDNAPHNAFTDLIRFNNTFYCVFREGKEHVSKDGKIRVIESKDANTWTSAALIEEEGVDLRDGHISITPDKKLMLIGGYAKRKKDHQLVPTATFVSFSKDARKWSKPQLITQKGTWLWQVSWFENNAYGISYRSEKTGLVIDLLKSNDGINFKPHAEKLLTEGSPCEATVRFIPDGTCYALVRRNAKKPPSSAMLGVSKPDYKKWKWFDLGEEFSRFGGPNFIQIPTGHWIGAGRMHKDGAHTAITYIDIKNATMTKLLKLPSAGDTSYPGLVWHNNTLYVSYYSSHEAKTSIYLAKLKVIPKKIPQNKKKDG